MPKKTYTQINSVTLASSASSVTFSSIPATYRDLVLVIDTTGDGYLLPTVNSDSGSNYSRVLMWGTGSTTGSLASTTTSFDIGQFVTSTKTNFILQFMDYSATDKHKTLLSRSNTTAVATNATVSAGAFRWANTAAITTITVPISGNYNSGSTFTLYGIEA